MDSNNQPIGKAFSNKLLLIDLLGDSRSQMMNTIKHVIFKGREYAGGFSMFVLQMEVVCWVGFLKSNDYSFDNSTYGADFC